MDIVIRFIFSFIALTVAVIQALIFLGFRSLLFPEGSLQNFFVLGLGIYFLGLMQLGFATGFFTTLFIIWKRL
jgi:hypothetical protein